MQLVRDDRTYRTKCGTKPSVGNLCTIGSSDYCAHRNDIFVFLSDTVFERQVIEPLECIYIQFDKFPIPLENGIIKFSEPIRAESSISFLKNA